MTTGAVETLAEEDTSQMDVYELSWYTFYNMEVYGMTNDTKSFLSKLSSKLMELEASIEENKVLLYVILYDKEIVIGVLLGYYVLLKSGFQNEQQARTGLSFVLSALRSFIDEYDSPGELLYVLGKLSEVTNMVRDFSIDERMLRLIDEMKEVLSKDNLRISKAEDAIYAIWSLCERNVIKRRGKDTMKLITEIALNDRLYNLVQADYKARATYASMLSSLILQCRVKLEGEINVKLRERSEELHKMLRHDLENLKQIDEGVSIALKAKIELALHNLNKALEKLREESEIEKVKRKYALLTLSLTVPLIILLISSSIFPSTIISIIMFISEHRIEVGILSVSLKHIILSFIIPLAVYLIYKIIRVVVPSRKLPKWILVLFEVLKELLKTLFSRGS